MVNLPSASTLAILRRDVAGRKLARKTLAIFADPVFNKEDERVNKNNTLVSNRQIPSLDNVPITQVQLRNSAKESEIKLERLKG